MKKLRKWLSRESTPATEAGTRLAANVVAVGDIAALTREGRHDEALARVCAALVESPDDPDLLFAKGTLLFQSDRFREAIEVYTRAAAGDHRTQGAALDLQLGWCYLNQGDARTAALRMQAAGAAEPNAPESHFGHATALHAQRRFDDAARSFERVLDLSPDDVDALLGAGSCKFEQGDLVAAESMYRAAARVDDSNPQAWALLGAAADADGRDDEALALFQRAMNLEADQGGTGDGFQNVAIRLRDCGRTDEAIALFEQYLPSHPAVHATIGYAVALLRSGRLAQGWPHYEFRWLQTAYLAVRPEFVRPAWTGQALHGKTIVLHAEQGLGDFIQFIRYAACVKALGARVVVIAPAPLRRLAMKVEGVDVVIGSGDPLPAFDCFAHLLSLPGVFGTDLATIPERGPYVRVERGDAERWAARLPARDGEFQVGVVWAGSPTHLGDRQRSIPLATMSALKGAPGIRFVSLQKGPRECDIATPAGEWLDLHLGSQLEDMSDTAAVVDRLDLVICVDTAVGHLAAAMGKPVWMLIATPCDFRWLDAREDTPWYPTMRLFRQRVRGDWDEVIADVRAALQELPDVTAASRAPLAVAESKVRSIPAPPNVLPRHASAHLAGMSAVAETRHGILQYFPDEPCEGDSLAWYGEWLEPHLTLLASLVQPGSVVLELGSGVGAHAIRLAQLSGAGGHLILAEPRATVARVLRQNLAANRVANATVLRNPVTTVDALCLDRLEWLKAAEASEAHAVVQGSSVTLWRLRPRLWIAVADDAQMRSLGAELAGFGYRCWRIATPLHNADNFNGRPDDLFGGREALALVAVPEESDPGMVLASCAELSLN